MAVMASQDVIAQTDPGADSYRKVFGTPNYSEPGGQGLEFLKSAQDLGKAVPSDKILFDAYVKNSSLFSKLSAASLPGADPKLVLQGVKPEIYHLIQWHTFALDMLALDHTTRQGSGPDIRFAEQVGPHRSSRAMAIVQLSVFEGLNYLFRRHHSHKGLQAKIDARFAALGSPPPKYNDAHDALNTSVRATIAAAAGFALEKLYPQKADKTAEFMRAMDPLIGDSMAATMRGMELGKIAAEEVLTYRGWNGADRFADGSETADGTTLLPKTNRNSLAFEPDINQLPPIPGPNPVPAKALWAIDPLAPNMKAIGGYWSFVEPFAIDKADLHLPGGPPALDSDRFAESYNDVRVSGGDPDPVQIGSRAATRTIREGARKDPPSEDNETFRAEFWAYDATALLCAPPRLYNKIATSAAYQLKKPLFDDVAELARFLALINVAMADAAIGAWTAKYTHRFARPITYIRATPDNSDNIVNASWTPLGAPTSNGVPNMANMTPPFPAYPSGHAVFGGALFTVLRDYFKKPLLQEKFKFVSDEYNGVNRGPTGDARPFYERTFANFDVAMLENAQSRVWLGIHWSFDGADGIKQGVAIAKDVMAKTLMPV